MSISIHSLLAEGDAGGNPMQAVATMAFQSTPSSRRETVARGWEEAADAIISIHSLLAEGDPSGSFSAFAPYISIHSLLAEGDRRAVCPQAGQPGISIHSLLAEGDTNECSLY